MKRSKKWLKKKWRKLRKNRTFAEVVGTIVLISWAVAWFQWQKMDWNEAIHIRITNPALASVEEANASDRSLSEGELAESSSAETGITPAPHAGDVEKMICDTFGEDCRVAVAVAKAESGLFAEMESTTDRMKDGRPYSIGMFQLNLTAQKVSGVDCPSAFQGRNDYAVVVNEGLYRDCVRMAKDARVNVLTAKAIYDRSDGTFGKWGAYNNGSYRRFLES